MRKVLIIGAARSGLAIARLMKKKDLMSFDGHENLWMM
jgi:UDP-N-acetylmuramoylalanine-D-glutamate ligase